MPAGGNPLAKIFGPPSLPLFPCPVHIPSLAQLRSQLPHLTGICAGTPEAFQHIRALPCEAGGLIAFSHRLLHWGSASDPHSGPRTARLPEHFPLLLLMDLLSFCANLAAVEKWAGERIDSRGLKGVWGWVAGAPPRVALSFAAVRTRPSPV